MKLLIFFIVLLATILSFSMIIAAIVIPSSLQAVNIGFTVFQAFGLTGLTCMVYKELRK